eukprot:3840311-Amphidinium_carterae.1
MKAGVSTLWTDGSGRHSSNPHFRRCGVNQLAMSLTRERGVGWRFLAVGNQSLELNSYRLFGLWRNASPAVLSVTVKVWSTPYRPYKVVTGCPKEGTGILKRGLGEPFLKPASSYGLKPTKL